MAEELLTKMSRIFRGELRGRGFEKNKSYYLHTARNVTISTITTVGTTKAKDI